MIRPGLTRQVRMHAPPCMWETLEIWHRKSLWFVPRIQPFISIMSSRLILEKKARTMSRTHLVGALF